MKYMACYYENPNVSRHYFARLLRQVSRLFSIKETTLIPIQSVENLSLPSYSHYPRIVLTHNEIKTNQNQNLSLDGVGFKDKKILLAKYQRTSIKETMFLLVHELGHVFGMSHCSQSGCIMGVDNTRNSVSYHWRKISQSKKLSKKLFCEQCKKHLASYL